MRKSLLITSVVGLFLKETQRYNTGKFSFLGFEIPTENFDLVLRFFVAIISFYLITFGIRYFNEFYTKRRVKFNEEVERTNQKVGMVKMMARSFKVSGTRELKIFSKINYYSLLILDFIFPVILGLISIF